MTKKQIYIDFEAISSPFNLGFGTKEDWPYAYSVGIFEGKKFKTSTYIMDFGILKSKIKGSQINIQDIYQELKINLEKDLKKLLKTSEINLSEFEFVAWSGVLERNILSKALGKKAIVIDLNTDPHLPLKAITANEISTKNYFETFKSDVEKQIDKRFYERRGLKHDGALAALAGYVLMLAKTNRSGRFFVKTNFDTLHKELEAYSLDDVLRMKIIKEKGQDWMDKQSVIFKTRNEEIQKISKILSKNSRLVSELANYNENLTIGEIIKTLNKEIIEQEKKLEKIREKK